jgi:hypothetical protein
MHTTMLRYLLENPQYYGFPKHDGIYRKWHYYGRKENIRVKPMPIKFTAALLKGIQTTKPED